LRACTKVGRPTVRHAKVDRCTKEGRTIVMNAKEACRRKGRKSMPENE
jgi:hypothetical protein